MTSTKQTPSARGAALYGNGAYSFSIVGSVDKESDMREKTYTRKEKRDAAKVTEKASSKDRNWFACHPDRTIYIRRALKGEVKAQVVMAGLESDLWQYPSKMHLIICVQQFVGRRQRFPFITDASYCCGANESEAFCIKQIYDECMKVGKGLDMQEFARQIVLRMSVMKHVEGNTH